MPGLELLAVGVGDAFSTRHGSTCFALRAEGRWILVDCPHPLRKTLADASRAAQIAIDVGDLDAVLLTHLHADHASGVEGYGFYSRYVLQRPARVAAHPAVSERLWDGHLAGGMEWTKGADGRLHRNAFADFFTLLALDDLRPVELGPFRIECRRTRHVVPTTALRITAAGRCLAYSADTEYDPALVSWLAPADLILHETGPGIHTPLEALAALDPGLRSKMRLVHYADRDALAGAPIAPLDEGRLYDV